MAILGWRVFAGVRACACRSETAITRAFSTASAEDASVWGDLTNVTKELQRIAREEGLGRAIPDTRLLKELGHRDLVLAIRKKHGGFVNVATKMGVDVDVQDKEIHKRIASRVNRRKKRAIRVDKHDFY